jgi:transcriptional regulator with XRE-family HTH domain
LWVLEVKRLRQERQWNQTELAYHAGLAPSVISQIENGKRDPSARTLRKLAQALSVEVGDLFPKAQAPLPDLLEDERRLRYLRGWRAFVFKLMLRWEQEPPKTRREIAPVFEAMTALMDEGAFELSKAMSSLEHRELGLFMVGMKALNYMADDVQAGEEAEQRRAALRAIESKIGA